MSAPKKTLIIIQAVAPDYRIPFFDEISKLRDLRLFAGDCYFSPSVKTSEAVRERRYFTAARNLYLLKRKLLIQTWPNWLTSLLSHSQRVVELNPRCATSWFSLICSGVLHRGQTFVWGHRLARNGSGGLFGVRSLMVAISNGVIFYSEKDTESFKQSFIGKHKRAWAAPNSTVSMSQISSFEEVGQDFLFSGRLIAEKKPNLLISAFHHFLARTGNNSRLHILGDGPLRKSCELLVKNLGIEGAVTFHGHQTNPAELSALYRRSIAAVSSGYGGLSITQAFSYGRPIIISRNEPHAPEIEQFIENINGEYFETDSIEQLSNALSDFFCAREEWARSSMEISDLMREKYSIETMTSGFLGGLPNVIQP